MLDVVLAVSAVHLAWFSYDSVPPLSGFPLFLLVYGVSGALVLPESTQEYGSVGLGTIFLLLVLTDLIQFTVHVLTHKQALGSALYASHCVHHKHRAPRVEHAFVTGILDALFQVVFPVGVALYAVRPNRLNMILYGVLLSNHLLFIHSGKSVHPALSWIIVTPEIHSKHHKCPNSHYSHVFRLWDHVFALFYDK